MKFFLPHAADDSQADRVYEQIRSSLDKNGYGPVTSRRIYHLAFTHNGKAREATVGHLEEEIGQTVIAIFEGPNMYYICTPNRGVRTDLPYLVGTSSAYSVIDFEV